LTVSYLKETIMKMWKVFRGHSVMTSGLLAAAFVLAPLSHATLITPGTGVTPAPSFGSGSLGTTLATIALPFSVSTLSGTVTEWVVTDSGTGDLDFIYQLAETTGTSEQVSVQNFSSVTTDVGYLTSGYGAAGTLAPGSITNVPGGVIDFNFDPAGVGPGKTTYDLVVKTNATSYIPGMIEIQDGSQAFVVGYGPTPEPGSVGLLLGGLFGLGLIATRKFRAQQS
jgi:hypothetical protein